MKYVKAYGLSQKEIELLDQSNRIEGEYSQEALEDAITAWKYLDGISMLQTRVVRKVHKILMKRLRPDIAGEWRHLNVMVGGQIKRFHSWQELEDRVHRFCTLTNWSLIQERNKKLQTKRMVARDLHVMFEDIHPFEDGNGRVGRLLYNWHRMKFGQTLHVVHEGEEQSKYYQWFKK